MPAPMYAKINGVWTLISNPGPQGPAGPPGPPGPNGPSGVNEVWIGTDDPIVTNPSIELWFDTDAVPDTAPIGVWQPWTPTMIQGSAVAVNVVGARYTRIGNTVLGDFHLVVISGGTPGNVISLSRPVPGRALSGTITSIGTSYSNAGGAGQMMLHVVDPGSTGGSFAFIRGDITNVANYFGPDPTITLAAGNLFDGSFMYEAA